MLKLLLCLVLFDKEKYYTKLVPVFIEFCKKAKEHNVICSMDCNRIPLCYFSKDEMNDYSLGRVYNDVDELLNVIINEA